MPHPESMNRRAFTRMAGTLGATAAFGGLHAGSSRTAWKERRDIFPEGVASGDPDASSVLLWTRAPHATRLQLEVASDAQFERVVATANTFVSADADFTCRVLVGGLKPDLLQNLPMLVW
jgi:alkaline phosphatase D